MWCCIEPERVEKTTWLMEAIAQGFGGKTCLGMPPDDGAPFFVWGQQWTALKAIPHALKTGRPFIQIDNGYINSAKGTQEGYYRFCVNGMSARFVDNAPASRVNIPMRPWRRPIGLGGHVVLAVPGIGFGRAIGLDMPEWVRFCQVELRRQTHRHIIVRPKKSGRTFEQDFNGAWALRTHSSNVAVDAVLWGLPVFVEATSPAAPVGVIGIENGIERPVMPNRTNWLNNLMAQQFTLEEITSGLAREHVQLYSKDF